MRRAHSLEAVEGEEMGRAQVRRGPTQARFTDETEGSESEDTRIADQIWAKIGPELRQSRDPKHRPPTPGPQRVRSVERRLCHQRAKMPRPRLGMRRAKRRNEVVHLQLREADHAVEMGHLNATSIRDSDISCVIARVLTFIRWDPMDCQ